MDIKANGNNIVIYGDKVIVYSTIPTPLSLETSDSDRFPSYPSAEFLQYEFHRPTTVSADFGDGIINTYSSSIEYGSHYLQFSSYDEIQLPPAVHIRQYIYPDGLTIPRVIKIIVNAPSNVKGIIYNLGQSSNTLDLNLIQFSKMQSFTVFNRQLSGYDALGLAAIKTMQSFSSPEDQYSGIIPLPICFASFRYFAYFSTILASHDFATSNLDKLIYMPNLTSLQLGAISDNMGGTGKALPDNFADLKLTTLSISDFYVPANGIRMQSVPPQIEAITTLTTLNLQAVYLTTWGNLSALTSLQSLSYNCGVPGSQDHVTGDVYFTTDIPKWIGDITTLKAVSLNGVWQFAPNPQVSIDTFVNNWYDMVTSIATIDSSNSNKRDMVIQISPSNGAFGVDNSTPIPSGTYQQPSGYIQGSNNGSPSSPLEKIWVMVNQYTHSWAYKTI